MAFKTCAIVSIGDEVVAGRMLDTNAPWLAERFASNGIACIGMETVSDDPAAIEQVLRRWMGRVDVLLTSGGLGPTDDDRTRQAFFSLVGGEVQRDEAAVASLCNRLERSGVCVNESQLRQADRPASMHSVPNDNGTAPGIEGLIDGTHVWVLPGPPDELQPMVRTHVLQAIESPSQRPAWNENIIAFGISESTAAQVMGESLLVDSELCGSIRVSNGLIHMRLEHLDREWAERNANCIREALGPYVLDRNATTPAEALVQQARACGLNIAAAESCTGGGIGAALTHKAGASDVFQGSIVTYANAAKVDLLGVPEPLLGDDGPGAVSGEVAAAMAIGASRALHADAAVSVTGIAGPGGGSDQKPVGTVWVGTVVQGDVRTRQLLLPGRRPRVRMWTVHAASQLLRWHIEGMHAPMQWDAKPPSSGESS